jgi:phage-related tail fiber protein
MPIFRGKNFVSAVSDYKDSVRVATKSNVNITSNVMTIDGVTLENKDRILLTGQSVQSQNGIYSWSSITNKLTRAEDADSIFELTPGNKVYVEEGNTLGKSSWTLITQGVITPGITSLVFAKESRINTTDVSGTYGGSGKTLEISLDETGEINSITEVDIDIDGGSF